MARPAPRAMHLPKFLACGGEFGGEVPLDLLTDKVVVAAGVERTAAFGVEGLLLKLQGLLRELDLGLEALDFSLHHGDPGRGAASISWTISATALAA